MSNVGLEIDRARGQVDWRHRGRRIRASVPDLADAAFEPVSGRLVALGRAGRGRLLLFDPEGSPAGEIAPPAGYLLSHLVGLPEGLAVVGQGEAAVEGWPDWHFLIDACAARLSRAGPAY